VRLTGIVSAAALATAGALAALPAEGGTSPPPRSFRAT
jgi:hypothetical protein